MGGLARAHFSDTLTEAQRLGRWNRTCEQALSTALDIGFATGGRMLPAEAEADQERALQARGCKRSRTAPTPSVLPPDEQFPPLGALDELQVQTWATNAYRYPPNAVVLEVSAQAHNSLDPSRSPVTESLTTTGIMRLRPRSVLSADDPVECIWASDHVIDYYGTLLRRTVLDRRPGEPRMFLFPTHSYFYIDRDVFNRAEYLKLHREMSQVRAEMLRPGTTLVFPSNQAGNHWVVSVVKITGDGEGDIYYYDSYGDTFQPTYQDVLQEWLTQERSELLDKRSPFVLRMAALPPADDAAVFRQENIYDCGIFAMMVMRSLVLRHVYSNGARMIPRVYSLERKQVVARSEYMRRLLLLEIVNQRVPFFDWNIVKP